MLRGAACFVAIFALATDAAADDGTVRRRLAASLFGETVGEVNLTVLRGTARTLMTYRSELRVVRDKVRLLQRAQIDSAFDTKTGALLRSRAQRCTQPEGGKAAAICTKARVLGAKDAAGAIPSLAAEIFLATNPAAKEACADVIDEESAARGRICATPLKSGDGVFLSGSKFGVPFTARVSGGLLAELELPNQGARFTVATGVVEPSDEDLFADPIPSSGDVAKPLRNGRIRMHVSAEPSALELLKAVQSPGQEIIGSDGASLVIETHRTPPPKKPMARKALDAAALLVMKARGSHSDCQSATGWFLDRAEERGWSARAAIGIAWVDGRFAYHSWVVLDTSDGLVPIDPLLAQVPADAGHLELSPPGDGAGRMLVAFRGGISLEIE